ncbi:MAG: orotidine 5'-phosphate decarboxylase [Patescibacteria group bacterium]|nr:orotidine 5'-phosphate decarboxylase [Patescibacteria group bacterium]MDD5715562.1 orotidine 5'-phosphate decarboxylase [Patescibacteria group bacterium]
MRLEKRKCYLQIALNRSLPEVRQMIASLPPSDRIIIEVGTPFVKVYGSSGIGMVYQCWSAKLGRPGYVVADLKCMDRGYTEVAAAAAAGASAATCLGLAPIETISEFIKHCAAAGIDSTVDMMNVEFPFEVLQKLRPLPDIVVLHRGVDEHDLNRERSIPLHMIRRIKGTYPVTISVAGCETFREVTSTVFNDADIAIVWRPFYEEPHKMAELAESFLKVVI